MTVSGVAFYPAALLVVLTAALAAGAPRTPQSVIAGMCCMGATAILFALSGAYALAAGMLLVPAAAAWLVWHQAREHRAALMGAEAGGPVRRWQIGAAVAVAGGALLVWAVAAHTDQLGGAGGSGNLVSVIHWREPIGALAVLVFAAFGVAGTVVIASESEDERLHEATAEERRRKQERIERRRADREAARRRPRGGGRT